MFIPNASKPGMSRGAGREREGSSGGGSDFYWKVLRFSS